MRSTPNQFATPPCQDETPTVVGSPLTGSNSPPRIERRDVQPIGMMDSLVIIRSSRIAPLSTESHVGSIGSDVNSPFSDGNRPIHTTSTTATNNSITSRAAPDESKPLAERIPSTADVLTILTADKSINQMLGYTTHFKEDCDRAVLFNKAIWEPISSKIFESICRCAASTSKEVAKMTTAHREDMMQLLDKDVSKLFGFENEHSIEKCNEASGILHYIGFLFIEEFKNQIKSSWGGKPMPIHSQINSLVSSLAGLQHFELFDDETLAERDYYVIGFIGKQLSNEIERRGKDSAIRKCMVSVRLHFLTPASNLERIEALREELPTSLTDERLAFGGLSYPDADCFHFFAMVEQVYATVATADNFVFRGGKLTREIMESILRNQNVINLFCGLLGDKHGFAHESICSVLEFLLKVFSHTRAKDLALRFNANNYKGSTVALRPTLAAMSTCNRKGKRKRTDSKKEPVTETDKKEHEALIANLRILDEELEADNDTSKKLATTEVIEEMHNIDNTIE